MNPNPLLAPAAVLVLWSCLVLLWLVLTRFPAFAKAGISLDNAPRGSRYVDVEKNLPQKVNWVSHNYTHLMEQPTIFYAAIAVLALAGNTSTVNTGFAWAYCGLRIVHSLWQGLVNTIKVRVALFTLSTLCLWVLAVNAVRATIF
jgi:hypothetical protein